MRPLRRRATFAACETDSAASASRRSHQSAFLGGGIGATLHETSNRETPATFAYSVTVSYVAIVTHGGTGWAHVRIDGAPFERLDGHNSGDVVPRWIAFRRSLPPGAHTLTISVMGGGVALDGVIVR